MPVKEFQEKPKDNRDAPRTKTDKDNLVYTLGKTVRPEHHQPSSKGMYSDLSKNTKKRGQAVACFTVST